MSALRDRIHELAALPANWDSHGAKPITPAATGAALALAPHLGPEWHVYPRANGGLMFERGDYDDVMVEPDGSLSVTLEGLTVGHVRRVLEVADA